jgi:hypothetical protein
MKPDLRWSSSAGVFAISKLISGNQLEKWGEDWFRFEKPTQSTRVCQWGHFADLERSPPDKGGRVNKTEVEIKSLLRRSN